jgi:hypothetical protein
MKARRRLNNNLEIELEGEKQKDLFAELAQADEVFGESKCGWCGEGNLCFRVRNSTAKQGKNKGKTFTYFEIVCRDCGCYLPMGQHNTDAGTLFPDRKIMNENGDLVYDRENRGWRRPSVRAESEE